MTEQTTAKLSDNLTTAIELFDKWHKAKGLYSRHKQLLRSPLPPKKHKHHSIVFATANINFINAANAFDAAYKKLTNGEKFQLAQLTARKY